MIDGTVKVSFSELRNASDEFETTAGQVQTITGDMMNMVNGLNSVWQGAASDSYRNQFNKLDDDMQRMIRMIQEHATDLKDMANRYETIENANADRSNTLAGDVIT